jgi:pimeloyl-ACP methyl ester carboxylesterase
MRKKYLVFLGEKLHLDESARTSAPGQFIKLADGVVHYEIAGPPDNQTVVLIPGFSVPYTIWDPTFEALVENGFRVLRYDLFGRGYSDRPDTVYNQKLFERQLLDLLQSLEITRPVDLIGWSMGGSISVAFTDHHPEMVRKLCLIDPAGLPWRQSYAARLAQVPIIGDWIMGLMGEKVLLSNLKDYSYSDQGFEKLRQEFSNQMRYVGFKKALLSSLRSGILSGTEEEYKRVGKQEKPTLLVWGREDQVVPFELSNKVREMIPKIEFHIIEKAAHVPHYEHPEQVNPILIEFLSRALT